MRVVATRGYDSRARKLFTPAERAAAELEIALQPAAWPVVAGTGGARKARAARGSRGKSGGARIIYYVISRRSVTALHAWEQGRRRPDRAARVLLAVIAREPEAVLRALAG